MKLNWGTGILIFIILFFIGIFSFIYFTTTLETNLVEKDYYPKELEYDSHQEKLRNTAGLEEKISFLKSKEQIGIQFPAFTRGEPVEGSIHLYRPSDYQKDIMISISLDTNASQQIPTGNLLPGKYIVKIDWSFKGIPYYQEEIYIH